MKRVIYIISMLFTFLPLIACNKNNNNVIKPLSGKTKIIAHKRNTLESIKRAINDIKADGVEVDVRKAPDGTFILSHDEPDWKKENIMLNLTTADQLFAFIKTKPHVKVNCDMKNTSDMTAFIKLIKEYDVESQIYFTGGLKLPFLKNNAVLFGNTGRFINLEVLTNREITGNKPTDEEINKLSTPSFVENIAKQCSNATLAGLNISQNNVTNELISACHTKNIPISVWTVDSFSVMDEFLKMGVDYITTNDVELCVSRRNIIQTWK